MRESHSDWNCLVSLTLASWRGSGESAELIKQREKSGVRDKIGFFLGPYGCRSNEWT